MPRRDPTQSAPKGASHTSASLGVYSQRASQGSVKHAQSEAVSKRDMLTTLREDTNRVMSSWSDWEREITANT